MGLSLKLPARFEPRPPRAAVSLHAWLLLPSYDLAAITIKDISAFGFMGETLADIRSDTWVGVMLPNCSIEQANVRWCTGGSLGASFKRLLDLERLREPSSYVWK